MKDPNFLAVLALPEPELLAYLRVMPLADLLRFRRLYSFGARSNGDVEAVPFAAHAIILERADPLNYADREQVETPATRRRRHTEHYRKRIQNPRR